MVAIAAADDKKVPPRHPLNRLNKLKIFYNRFANRFAVGMCNNFEAAFNRPNCGYYDSSSKHGGPDPNPEIRENGKPRARRDDDEEAEVEADFEDLAAFCAENADNFSKLIF